MNPSNPAKFGIAFALGLVVALAGVTVYVKTSGLHVQSTPVAGSPAVQQTKQPEFLNAPKAEKAEETMPAPTAAPKPVDPPSVAEVRLPAASSPQKTAAPPPPLSFRPKTVVSQPHLVRTRYAHQSYPESHSSIRVEVSQVRQPSEPAISQAPFPATSNQPIRVVDEDQAQPISAPAPVAAPQPPPSPQPHSVTLQAGTNISIRMGETLSSDRNFSGDTFRGTLDRPIILDGFVIAEKGSKVLGKIAGLDKAGKFEGTSNLQLSLTEINTTDGQRVRIQTAFVNRQGASANSGREVAKVGGGAVLGAIIGGIAGGGKGAAIGAGAGGAAGAGAVMLGKGRPAVVPTEAQLTFQLAAPTTIIEHLN